MTRWFPGSRSKLAAETASAWLERLERTLQKGESQQLREWLKVRRHREVILEKCTNWYGPEILAVLGKLMPVEAMSARAMRKAKWSRTAAAATVAFCLVGLSTALLMGWMPWSRSKVPRPHPGSLDKTYQTAINARQEVRLPDGSMINLNTATQVVVNYGPKLRELSLVAGEATFKIAAEAGRPIRLAAGKRLINTERSQFNIRLLTPEKFDLTVISGDVTVLSAFLRRPKTPADLRNTFSSGETTLHSLQEATVESHRQTVHDFEPLEVQARLAWQRGTIVIADRPLESALAEVERYTTTRFVLTDERLHELRLSGEFRTGDVEGVLHTLHEEFQIDAQSDGTGRIALMYSTAH